MSIRGLGIPLPPFYVTNGPVLTMILPCWPLNSYHIPTTTPTITVIITITMDHRMDHRHPPPRPSHRRRHHHHGHPRTQDLYPSQVVPIARQIHVVYDDVSPNGPRCPKRNNAAPIQKSRNNTHGEAEGKTIIRLVSISWSASSTNGSLSVVVFIYMVEVVITVKSH